MQTRRWKRICQIICEVGGGNENNRYVWTDEETKLFLELDLNILNSYFYFSFFVKLSRDSRYLKM